MNNHKPLTVGEIEELKRISADYDKHGVEWKEAMFVLEALPRLLFMLTSHPDAAVKEAVEFSAEARCSRLARGILRIGKKLRVMRADMASQTDALIAAMYAINDAGILMPDEVLNYVSTERAVQAPRLTPEQVEAVKMAETLLTDTMSDYGDCEHDVGHCICKYHSGVFSLRSAFPDLFTGEVGRGE